MRAPPAAPAIRRRLGLSALVATTGTSRLRLSSGRLICCAYLYGLSFRTWLATFRLFWRDFARRPSPCLHAGSSIYGMRRHCCGFVLTFTLYCRRTLGIEPRPRRVILSTTKIGFHICRCYPAKMSVRATRSLSFQAKNSSRLPLQTSLRSYPAECGYFKLRRSWCQSRSRSPGVRRQRHAGTNEWPAGLLPLTWVHQVLRP